MVAVKKKLPRLADGDIDVDQWLEEITATHQISNNDLLKKSLEFAKNASRGLTTFYGQPCIEQGLEMAEIILDLHLDQEAVACSIITSTVEHTKISIESIQEKMGDDIAKLIKGVQQMKIINTLLSNINKKRDQTQIDRLRKTFLAMISDIRVVLIKLAEQMCILRGIKNINLVERKRIAQETLDIYAPLANRLGIGQLKWELEDLSFHYSDPQTYKMIAKFLAERRVDRENRIHEVIAKLKEQFAKTHIKSQISGRAKHIYSIYLKMQKKHLDYKDIYDASAVRVLVPTIEDCYNALSVVHQLWEHIKEEFDDYIANPKLNGYRSIHTAVIGPEGKHLEIQIRSQEMHDEAEHGIAAHWVYKENKLQQSGYETKITYLRRLLEWHKELTKQAPMPDKSLDEVFEDRVYVFTPAGDIIDLNKGATPLDFAYHVHSEVGNRTRGAKIDGHIVPLTYQLRTGDRVEIITAQNGSPSRDWLNKDFGYLKTPRARAKVAQWFRQQDVDQYIEAGKNILEREFARTGIHQVDLQKIASQLSFKNTDAMFISLGHGSLRPSQVSHLIDAGAHHEAIHKPIPHIQKKEPSSTGLQVAGINDLLTRIAKCCKPIPGDPIIGFITQGRGVSIHRSDCNNISHLTHDEDKRIIAVDWDDKHKGSYYVDLQIRAQGREKLIGEITSILSNIKVDLIHMNSSINKKNELMFLTMTVQIYNKDQLQALITEIKKIPTVSDVRRLTIR